MDHWLRSVLFLIFNVKFLFGLPDLQSFLPFEIEEDLLLALGFRYHTLNQGQRNLWNLNSFGNNNNVPEIFKPRQSSFGNWIKQQMRLYQNQMHNVGVSTSTVHTKNTSSVVLKDNILKTRLNVDNKPTIDNTKNTKGLSDSKQISDVFVHNVGTLQRNISKSNPDVENSKMVSSSTTRPMFNVTETQIISNSHDLLNNKTNTDVSSKNRNHENIYFDNIHTFAQKNASNDSQATSNHFIGGAVDSKEQLLTNSDKNVSLRNVGKGSDSSALLNKVSSFFPTNTSPSVSSTVYFTKKPDVSTELPSKVNVIRDSMNVSPVLPLYIPAITSSTKLQNVSPSLPDLKSKTNFREDLKDAFSGVETTQGVSKLGEQIKKDSKTGTVEFRPFTQVYKTVTPGYTGLLADLGVTTFVANPKYVQSVSNVKNGYQLDGKVGNTENTRHFDSSKKYTTGKIDSGYQDSHLTTNWPHFNGVSLKPRDISVQSSVVIPSKQSSISSIETSNKSTSSPIGIPIQLSFLSAATDEVQRTDLLINEQINIPLTARLAKGACDGCKMYNGAGYNSHPTDCDKYVQCYFNGDSIVTAYYRNCPWGQYWNQDILSCQPPQNAKCKNDPCANTSLLSYAEKSSCKSYWTCQGYSVPKCCPEGHMFLQGVGCVQDGNCQDDCLSKTAEVYTGCDKRSISSRPSAFEQYVTGHGWLAMECASGTRYNDLECSCSLTSSEKTLPNKCISLMFLEFNEGVRDSSGNDVYVQNENVEIKNGYSYFNGTARLVIPQFTNADLGSNFGFRIRFSEIRNTRRFLTRQSLINNGDCGDLGSIRLTLEQNGVKFGLETENEDNAVEFSIAQPQSEWTEVVYYVSEGKLSGWVNGNADSRTASGAIEKRKCALQIGHGEGFNNFVGYIDEVELFRCDSGVWDQQTLNRPQQALTLPVPVTTTKVSDTTIPSTTVHPSLSTKQSNVGIFVTIPNETTSPSRITSKQGIFISMPQDRSKTTMSTSKASPTTTTAATLPPIDARTLPPITDPVETTSAIPPTSTSKKPTIDPWRSMPPVIPVTTVVPWSSLPPTSSTSTSTTTTPEILTQSILTTTKTTSTTDMKAITSEILTSTISQPTTEVGISSTIPTTTKLPTTTTTEATTTQLPTTTTTETTTTKLPRTTTTETTTTKLPTTTTNEATTTRLPTTTTTETTTTKLPTTTTNEATTTKLPRTTTTETTTTKLPTTTTTETTTIKLPSTIMTETTTTKLPTTTTTETTTKKLPSTTTTIETTTTLPTRRAAPDPVR